LRLKFSYAVKFHKRAIDKRAIGQFSVEQLHLYACGNGGVFDTGCTSAPAIPAWLLSFGVLGDARSISHPTFGNRASHKLLTSFSSQAEPSNLLVLRH
jgi:hypothetical protein